MIFLLIPIHLIRLIRTHLTPMPRIRLSTDPTTISTLTSILTTDAEDGVETATKIVNPLFVGNKAPSDRGFSLHPLALSSLPKNFKALGVGLSRFSQFNKFDYSTNTTDQCCDISSDL